MSTRQNVPFAAFAALATLGLLAFWRVDPPLDARCSRAPATPLADAAPLATGTDDPEHPSHAERLAVRLPPSLELAVVDAHDRRPVPAARVQWRSVSGAARGEAVTSRAGAATLAAADDGPWVLMLRAPGHAPLHAVLPAVTGTAVVAMERGGELVVTALDAAGRPASGVGIAVLPPRAQGSFGGDFVAFANAPAESAERADDATSLPELVCRDGVFRLREEPAPADRRWRIDARWHAIDRHVVTGADGTARWSGLPPASGYRFGILPPRHGDTEPPHERQRLSVGAAGVTVGAAPPMGLSGTFAIELDAPTHVTARITHDGTLRGRFVVDSGTSVPARLFRISQAGGGDTVAVTALDVAAVAATAADGSFSFTPVRPGDYALRSCWMESGNRMRFASVTVRVPPGADVDVGDVPPTVGHTVTVEVGIEDVDGTALHADEVFADPTNAAASLLLDLVPDDALLADSLNELCTLPIGVPFVLQGLPAGRLQLTAMPAGNTPTAPEVARLLAGDTGKHMLPQPDTLRPRLRVERGHTIAITTFGAGGTERQLGIVWTRERATGRIESHTLAPEAPGHAEQLRLRPGDYELFAAVGDEASAECASTTLSVPRVDGSPLLVQLQPAACVRGSLRDANGRPAAGAQLRWTMPGWSTVAGVWPFTATCDVEGRFELRGLPTGYALLAGTETPDLPQLAAGWNTVQLTR